VNPLLHVQLVAVVLATLLLPEFKGQALQSSTLLCRVVDRYVPTGHASQDRVFPSVDEYFPASQSVQDITFGPDAYLPEGQMSHPKEEEEGIYPSKQALRHLPML